MTMNFENERVLDTGRSEPSPQVCESFRIQTARGPKTVRIRCGLLPGIWCINPAETLSPGQEAEIDRVYKSYPHLHDDAFVKAGLASWLAD